MAVCPEITGGLEQGKRESGGRQQSAARQAASGARMFVRVCVVAAGSLQVVPASPWQRQPLLAHPGVRVVMSMGSVSGVS